MNPSLLEWSELIAARLKHWPDAIDPANAESALAIVEYPTFPDIVNSGNHVA